MEHSKIQIKKHTESFEQLKKDHLAFLRRDPAIPEDHIRDLMDEWVEGFHAGEREKDQNIDWYEGMPPFRDPEYRLHPLTGQQVRSRHKFEPEGKSQEQRLAAKKSTPRRQPKLTPYELNPEYHDPKEAIHGQADLKGVKQYPITLEEEIVNPSPIKVKSARLQRSVDILELKLGYDHTSNKHVLYSPLAYNERWDRQSQVIWLRIIGMSPKRIGIRLKINYDTVKNWLRALKNQPLAAATVHDWAIRQVEGKPELMTRFSSVEAKPRAMERIQ